MTSASHEPVPKLKGIFLAFFLTTLLCGLVSIRTHYALPEPLDGLFDSVTGLPQLSEKQILEQVKELSEAIGYRTVGTREHALGEEWLLKKANELQEECQTLAELSHRNLECEVFRQEGNGTHLFDMMDRRVYKNYVNLSNVVFRLSGGTSASKEHAILVNAHLDSTLPSPGAADDALPSVIMLDCIRVLINTPDWSPTYSVIFLWNNAEESLQDGSHLFATQNPLAKSARAVINLEAAGVSGPELLFQANSEEMIQAYSHVPYPYGTVLANDIFSSGIILSDTDFRQFQEYGNLTGLDMAIVGDSYLYHTRHDIVQNIQPGVTQHMAANTLALLRHLTSPESPLLSIYERGPQSPKTAFISFFGRYFVQWSFETAIRLYNTFFAISFIAMLFLGPSLTDQLTGFACVIGGLVGGLVTSNLVAYYMSELSDQGLSWFAREWAPIALFGPPAVLGVALAQFLVTFLSESSGLEYASVTSLHMVLVTSAAALQNFVSLGSAGTGAIWALSTAASLVVIWSNGKHESASQGSRKKRWQVSALAYAAGQVVPGLLGTEVGCALLDLFVPLTGRIGKEAPGEHIVATIVAVLVFLVAPFFTPFFHRIGRRALGQVIIALVLITALSIMVFKSAVLPAFDTLHPRRLFVLHTEEVDTGSKYLHVSIADSAPNFPAIVSAIAENFGENASPESSSKGLEVITMDEWNADWDILYPFSQFLTPYKIPLSLESQSARTSKDREAVRSTSPGHLSVHVKDDKWDATSGTRSLTLVIDHPGVIWSVIAFDAHVLQWSLDSAPLPHYTRHHVKEASFYGTSQWTLSMIINANNSSALQQFSADGKPLLEVSYQGIDELGMWPAKQTAFAKGVSLHPAIELFASLDAYLAEYSTALYGSVSIDAMMLAVTAGKAVL